MTEINSKVLVRQSGHFLDQKLKYFESDLDKRVSIGELSRGLKADVEKHCIECEGIRLSVAEDRLMMAIFNILRERSEHCDESSESFYRGNKFSSKSFKWTIDGEEVELVQLWFQPAELYKEYLGRKSYSGACVRDIQATLKGLAEKWFLIRYKKVTHSRNGKRSVAQRELVERVKRLIIIEKAPWDPISPGEKKMYWLLLNPILVDQITSKYVLYPKDINLRTVAASGGKYLKVTTAMNTLRDWCIREISAKRYEFQINSKRLPYILGLYNFIKEGRKKRIQKIIFDAIQTCKNLDLILDVTEVIGTEGQMKFIFKLNPKFGRH